MRRVAAAVLATALGLSAAAPAAAQEALPQSPVLTLDEERLFTGSAFGKRVLAELMAAERELAAENRALEEELVAAERALTEQRPTTPPDVFRGLADAFDARVQQVRQTQDAKARELARRRDAERQRFFEAAVPVLGDLAREAGAVAILSRQAIILSFDRIDVTDAAIARLDATLGDGREPDAD
jgi:Skp family chaperone for outer membrane proteins